MPIKELPVIITPDIASHPRKLAKAIMRNFDHLIGEAGHTQNLIEAGPDSSILEEIAAAGEGSESLAAILNEQGVGGPDGSAPTVAPTGLSVTAGINYDLWVTWVPIKNNSPVTYKIERRVGIGGAWTEVATTVVVPGQDKGHWHHHDTGLAMNTDYYYRVRATDDDGTGPYSAITGPHQVNKTVNEQIADATINIATKVTGLLPQANLSTISDPAKLADGIISSQATFDRIVSGAVIAGQHIVGGTIVSSKLYSGAVAADRIQANNIAAGAITAEKISVDDLAAINANLGSIISGSLTAVNIYSSNLYSGYIEGGTIVGSNIYTGPAGQPRIGLGPTAGTNTDVIAFYGADGVVRAQLGRFGGGNFVISAGTIWMDKIVMQGDINMNGNFIDGALDATGRVSGSRVEVGTSVVNPPAGYVSLYKVGNELRARDNAGTVRTLCTF